jgi:hypothetical protein
MCVLYTLIAKSVRSASKWKCHAALQGLVFGI